MVYRKETELNGKKFAIETNRVARQADGACWVQFGETIVMATVVGAEEAAPEQDFFPLTVDYREKAYAAGKIPGGYFKREGKPSDSEILSARLIDRSLRPLFAEDYRNEVQIMVSVLSADKENDPDTLGITAASMVMLLSGIPWAGPVAGIRVGRVNGQFVANPTHEQTAGSDIDLMVAATEDSIMMVEGEAQEISEADMVAALAFASQSARQLIQMQKAIAAEAAKPKRAITPAAFPEGLENRLRQMVAPKLTELLKEADKQARRTQLKEFYKTTMESLLTDFPESEKAAGEIIHMLEKELVRAMIVKQNRRLDGRDPHSIRQITCEVAVLPRVHGTCLFTRGQTQALAAITLGTKIDEQKMDELEGEFYKSYMLHYNFPPYSVGEIRPARG